MYGLYGLERKRGVTPPGGIGHEAWDAGQVPGKKLRDKTVTKGFSVRSIIFLNKASDGCSLRDLQSSVTGGNGVA